MTTGSSTILENRAAVAVSGPDARDFLQGLITQDIKALDARPLLYGAMLNAQGRMDYDFFISQKDDAIFLETESARADALAKKLSLYKLRKNITITMQPAHVLVMWNSDAKNLPRDPRHPKMGYRALDMDASVNATPADYHVHCLNMSVPSGSLDIAWGEDTPADINLERLNGVSYTKGCYMGQELTSRMHHRNLGKKGLYAVTVNNTPLPAFTDIIADGNLIGEMRSSAGNTGLAMLRHDSMDLAKKAGLLCLS